MSQQWPIAPFPQLCLQQQQRADMFIEGSLYLFDAFEKKVYFKDITILVPAQWKGTDLKKLRTESFEEVVSFCKEDEHNGAAPNRQIEKCGNKATWTVIYEDSVDSDALKFLKPLPSFTVVRRMQPGEYGKENSWLVQWSVCGSDCWLQNQFKIIFEHSAPTAYIQTPSGSIYSQADMRADPIAKTLTLKIPGNAESGDWKYSILSGRLQSLTITVTIQAARSDVPPIIVKGHVNKQLSDGSKPVILFAEVSQNYRLVINAEVNATLEPENGTPEQLVLLDNGADEVAMNPLKPLVHEQALVEENFSRTATGESFEVSISKPPNYPPNKIIDLNAEIQENTVFLIWTAPGDDFDLGTAKSYEIIWSDDLEMFRVNFSNSSLINTSALSPEAGSVDQHSFNMTIENGTTLFFALRSQNNEDVKSEISNIPRHQRSCLLQNPQHQA
ncbi:Calcium-activated chloride channel regulator 1 [Triplophysa tibetana]|uniref:Calcium-activated chloride channel regulator 1 n=1 Tax=Triplophysa tibetana TaxID=1572043 RepID=A0A5A9NJR5_9TELE|nr:Calcium-activated chloride channel regulator 1 [Triplophysa tibetana]